MGPRRRIWKRIRSIQRGDLALQQRAVDVVAMLGREELASVKATVDSDTSINGSSGELGAPFPHVTPRRAEELI
ncbi:hypothetical protein NDU88_003103 [Pleurodeles waltl]|uniref:Uncharacterized protein n=1 Tax=Pleurodeles waltl TaxID=8319 RepID=A0AAV7LFQ6_PLEWA|nr:hypothetical protein NDU88_003103 [Pleurodeles waltl]